MPGRAASKSRSRTVEARELFLNLPVRRGFLGTVRAEANAVATVVEALALSRPDVGFSLRSDGRRTLALPAAADLRERIAQVHGLSLARSLIALEDPVLWGFVSPLAVSFPTRRYLHVAVNGRVVEADSFAPAVSKAYADLLPKGDRHGSRGGAPRGSARARWRGRPRQGARLQGLYQVRGVSLRGRDGDA